MTHRAPEILSPETHHHGVASFLLRQWPYFVMLLLALFGVAYTSVTRQGMTTYWIALAPIFGLISIAGGWQEAETAEEKWRLLRTQVLHWGAVLAAMCLIFISDVRQIMNSDSSALTVLTVLALGSFTAGIHADAWRVSLVGLLLALAVPAIAWLEESTLLILLIVAVIAVIGAFVFLRDRKPA
ncbi:hypothetical protein MSC49_05160 [Methylosinus sp. C49]|uniref:hypothetical protein n=1 Tax=Methylosinus sp. C49 TaxID=2699395 RepID=UPI001366FACD|nr:hypothetical protein [Methylosinus sp. C49]BBU60581.1 hypothetical protein MSC49_05160 [Methylosinus sp. C49]